MHPLLGPSLQARRERLALTLQDAAHKTRISVPRLRALELDDYASFGSPFYARCFLKLYSDFLSVDASQTLEWLARQQFPPPPESPALAAAATASAYGLWNGSPNGVRDTPQPRRPSAVPAVVALTLMTLAATGLWVHSLSADWQRRQQLLTQLPPAVPASAQPAAPPATPLITQGDPQPALPTPFPPVGRGPASDAAAN